MTQIPSAYKPPFLFRNGHFSTMYSGLVRKVKGVHQTRERLELPDGDFMDLDWSKAQTKTASVVILLHGLEGNAQRAYITGSALAFNQSGIDACAINLRSCSGVPNRLFRSYHSGATEDLQAVVEHLLETKAYTTIYIKGFSLGGNLTLKYLGEGRRIPKQVKAAITVSVPCSLHSSLKQLLLPKNMPYALRFKKNLIAKLKAKKKLFPDLLSDDEIKAVVTLKDFDDVYTSKAHGFKDAEDYYTQCSCLQFLKAVGVPSLIINAANDSFLGPECYPIDVASMHPHLHLEIPKYGGHVGFVDRNNSYYNEKRAIKFLNELG